MRPALLTLLISTVAFPMDTRTPGPETWKWLDVPGAVCGNGNPTGIGVNFTSRSDDLLIYLMPGGACWDAQSCRYGGAANLSSGYDRSDFANESALLSAAFDRSVEVNPFKSMGFVFVPYCTGDVHAGHSVQTYGAMTVHHAGGTNFGKYLEVLHSLMPNVKRVFVTGSSAGAFGAQLNFERVVATWPGAEVHLLADSGQILQPSGSLYRRWLAAWKLDVPPDAPQSAHDFTEFPKYLHAKYPHSRFGLIGSTRDTVLPYFFQLRGEQFAAATEKVRKSAYAPFSNTRVFLTDRPEHVLFPRMFDDPKLLQFVTDFVK